MSLFEADVKAAFALVGVRGWTVKPHEGDRWLDAYAERGNPG